MHLDCAAPVDCLVYEACKALKYGSPPEVAQFVIANFTRTRCRAALVGLGILSLLLAVANLSPASAQLRNAALGVWLEEEGQAQIQISPCGDKLCGHIVWLKMPVDDDGRPLVDKNNPDPALRSRPILGMLIMAGLQPNEDNTYLEGQVYNSENGKIYDIFLTPGVRTMEVEGCLLKYLCDSQTWTRVR